MTQKFTIKIPIYKTYVVICIGVSDEVLRKEIGDFDFPINRNDIALATSYLNKNGKSVIDFPEDLSNECVAHELLHVCFHIMQWIGFPLSDDGTEPYCYLMEYLTKEFYKNYKPCTKQK